MSKKRKVCVTLDGELVDLHKWKSSVPLSTDLNHYLQESLLCSDEIEDIKGEIERHEKKVIALKQKLTRVEQMKINKINQKNNFASCYDTLVKMQEANDVISIFQIRLLAEHRGLDYDGLLDYCEKENFKIVEADKTGSNKKDAKGKYVGMVKGEL